MDITKKISNLFLLMLLMLLLTLTAACSNKKSVEAYFCHQEDCGGKLGDEIRKANENVYFMSYTLTNGRVASELIIKSNEGVEVKGIIESMNINGKGSKYELLRFQGIDVKKDNSSGLMHHKVFIIDKKLVVTGSFNPTEAADEKNDDNMVIIRDEFIAEEYLKEFNRLYFSGT